MSVIGSTCGRLRLASVVMASALLVTAAAGCSGSSTDAATPSATATSPAAAGETRPDHVAPEAFASALGKQGVVLLDVRTAQEFAEGHLDGAQNVDVQAPDFGQRIRELDTAASYLVYCRTGRRSGVAVDQLKAAGFTDVTGLAGGIVAWAAEGRSVVTG